MRDKADWSSGISPARKGLTSALFAILAIATAAGVLAQSVPPEQNVPCSYAIDPANQAFGGDGGGGSIAITSPANCPWTAEGAPGWISLTSGDNGNGNGTLTYFIAANDTASSRSGNLVIAGQTFTVFEDGASCSYSVSPASQSFGAFGGTGSVAVTALTGCGWMAMSNDSWISLSSGDASGDGTVSVSASANDSGLPRMGSLTIAGQTLMVTQDGVPCTYSISPSGATFGADGGGAFVSVTAPRDCQWMAMSGSGWIAITSGAGSGDGTVAVSVPPNPGTEARTDSVSIAGMSFFVTQAGQPPAAEPSAAGVESPPDFPRRPR
jgi:hypothetical protein